MNWEDFRNEITGKVILIGLNFLNDNEELVEQYQTHGILIELTDTGLLLIKRRDGSIFQIPYDSESIAKAEEGEYKENSTGIIISNPDYITTWEIIIDGDTDLERIKAKGYEPES
jgi:hypothetical protein